MVSHSFTYGPGLFGVVTILGATVTIMSNNGSDVNVLSAPIERNHTDGDRESYVTATHAFLRVNELDRDKLFAPNLVDLVGMFLKDLDPQVAEAVERFVLSWIIKGPVKQ